MVQGLSFSYGEDKVSMLQALLILMCQFQPLIYKNLEFGVDLESRIALVGPNGAGKSTLLKLIDGEVCIFIILLYMP